MFFITFKHQRAHLSQNHSISKLHSSDNMRDDSIEAWLEGLELERTKQERLPRVLAASAALQDAEDGIAPPHETVGDNFSSPRDEQQQRQQQQTGEHEDDSTDGDEDEDEEMEARLRLQLRNSIIMGLRDVSSPPSHIHQQQQQQQQPKKKQPTSLHQQALFNATAQKALRSSPRPRTEKPPSPPPRPAAPEPPSSPPPPPWWTPSLSDTITNFLRNPETQTQATDLNYLELRPSDYSSQPLRFDSEDFVSLRLLEIRLPGDEGEEWCVLHGLLKVEAEKGLGEREYWLIAFEREMITAEMDSSQDKNESSTDEEAIGKDNAKRKVEDESSKVVVWSLEKTGQWPPVHGKGISDRFAEDFVRACGEGKGIVEMRSQDDTEVGRKRKKGGQEERD